MSSKRKDKITLILIFVTSSILDFIMQLLAFAYHPGNMVPGAMTSYREVRIVAWEVLSFPMFRLLGETPRFDFFYVAVGLNCLLWASAITILYAFWRSRVRRLTIEN